MNDRNFIQQYEKDVYGKLDFEYSVWNQVDLNDLQTKQDKGP